MVTPPGERSSKCPSYHEGTEKKAEGDKAITGSLPLSQVGESQDYFV